MISIPYPDLERVSEAKRAYATDPKRNFINVTHMLMHAPEDLWKAKAQMLWATSFASGLDMVIRELVILRVAYLSNSDYELYHHLPVARNIGMSEETLDALRTGSFAGLPPDQRAVAQLVTELVLDVSPSDATLTAVRERFSDETLFAIVLVAGAYMTLARVAAVGRIERDAKPVSGFKTVSDRLA